MGYDLAAKYDIHCKRGITWIPTGVAIEAQYPLWFTVIGRSSLHKRGLFMVPATVDCGYQGEIQIGVVNVSDEEIFVQHNEYIAQAIFYHVTQPYLQQVEKFSYITDRGTNGFGSTDR